VEQELDRAHDADVLVLVANLELEVRDALGVRLAVEGA